MGYQINKKIMSKEYEYKEDMSVRAIRTYWEGSEKRLQAGNSYWVVKNPRNNTLYVGNRFNEVEVDYVEDYIVPQNVYESNKEKYDKVIKTECLREEAEINKLNEILKEAFEDLEQSVCPLFEEWWKKWHKKGIKFEYRDSGDYANYDVLSYLTVTGPHHTKESEELPGFTVEKTDD